MSIEMLDVYTLARIFSHLDSIGERLKMESVCKKWQKACRDSITWKNIEKLDLIKGKYAVKKKFSDTYKIYQYFEKLFAKFGTHLKSLSFFVDKLTMSFLSDIHECCPNLTHLELEFKRYSDYQMVSMFGFDEHINEETFQELKKLKSLIIDNYYVTHELFCDTTDTKILESLNAGIEEISLTASSPRSLIPSQNFAVVTEQWHSLKKLTLDYWDISDSLWNIFTSKTSLTFLSLNGCEISKSQILQLTQLKNLESLIFCKTEGVHNLLMFKIAKELKNLKQLNLSWCHELSTDALKKIGDLKKLNFLSLMYVDNVDDSVVLKIINNCKMLEYLNLSGCENPTNQTLYKIGKLQHLETLHVNSMDQVDDKIFDHIKNLKTVGCDECKNLTDAGVDKLLKSSPNLEVLIVSKTGITSKSLFKFCEAKTNSNGKQYYMKANATAIIEYLSVAKRTPNGVCLMRPLDVDSDDGSYYSDDDDFFCYIDNDYDDDDSDDDDDDDDDDEDDDDEDDDDNDDEDDDDNEDEEDEDSDEESDEKKEWITEDEWTTDDDENEEAKDEDNKDED